MNSREKERNRRVIRNFSGSSAGNWWGLPHTMCTMCAIYDVFCSLFLSPTLIHSSNARYSGYLHSFQCRSQVTYIMCILRQSAWYSSSIRNSIEYVRTKIEIDWTESMGICHLARCLLTSLKDTALFFDGAQLCAASHKARKVPEKYLTWNRYPDKQAHN